MEFLDKHQEEMIENNSSVPTAGIYMAVKPYQPIRRYKTSGGSSSTAKWLVELLSSFVVPVRNPVADLVLNVSELDQTLKSLHLNEGDRNRKLEFSPWTVFAVTFSVSERNKGSHFIGERSVDFGTIRRILKHAC